MAYDKTKFLSGLVMGLCSKGNPTFSGEKCLYNGVELPDINTVWTDKATYPYALIVYNGAEYEVYISQGMFYYAAAGKWKSSAPNKYYLRNNNEWVFQYDKSGLSLSYLYWTPTWTNADIYTEGNSPTLKFAASDPVPVEDVFTKGYLVGAELRSKRVVAKWETVYERNYPATDNKTLTGGKFYNGYGENGSPTVKSMLFVGGDIVRLTVDGASTIHTADGSTSVARIGNAWLGAYTTDTDVSDNGFDFYVKLTNIDLSSIGGYNTYHLDFYARNSGTYSVKIEKLVK